MLRNIHKASSTWLGKGIMAAVMGILVVSFAIWGIADIFRGGFGQNDVATMWRIYRSFPSRRCRFPSRTHFAGFNSCAIISAVVTSHCRVLQSRLAFGKQPMSPR